MNSTDEAIDRTVRSRDGVEIPTGALEARSYWQNVFLLWCVLMPTASPWRVVYWSYVV